MEYETNWQDSTVTLTLNLSELLTLLASVKDAQEYAVGDAVAVEQNLPERLGDIAVTLEEVVEELGE